MSVFARGSKLLLLVPLLAACSTLEPRRPGSADVVAESRVVEIKDLAEVAPLLASDEGLETLLVLDIDDTLLTSATFFGSDSWYEWQKTLDAGQPGWVPCRFDVIALNYEAGTQVPTQTDAAALINAIEGDALMLTARNPAYRAGTLRELQRAGYELPAMLGGADGVFFEWRQGPKATPYRLSYDQGVMMVTGQDKGHTLLALMQRRGLSYDRVVLVDDGRKNIDAMQDALAQAGIDYLGLWYTRVDKTISETDKAEGIAGWNAWYNLLATTFPERLRQMEAGTCAY